MENAEEVMHSLEEFCKLKPKDIPRELEDYLGYVAKTGDPVFKWSIIKCLFREKLLNVITDFYESTLTIELPPCPNVDPFNYERMKANLLEKLDSFSGAPFTVQRISELLTNPWKEYNRADKFMRAIEKNILVVSTREPGRYSESEADSQQDTSFNGISAPNDSDIENTIAFNELAVDADSSSQPYDINAATQAEYVHSSIMESKTFKENGDNIGDSASPNELGIIRNDEVSQEIIIEGKDTETVICSTLASETDEELQQQSEDVSETETEGKPTEPTDLTVTTETVTEGSADSNTPDSKDVVEEPKEAMIVEVVATESAVVSMSSEEEGKSTPSVVDSSDSSERLDVVSNSVESSEEGSESSSSQIFEESRPTECDTSNSFDSETSNSCDSEVEIKTNEEQTSDTDTVSKAADSTEINEAASTSSYVESEDKEAKPEPTIEQPENESPCESTEMEVGECQISLVDQSES